MKQQLQIPLRALIITDRLFEPANKLADYFKATGHIYVMGMASGKEEAIEIAKKEDFDYLIIAGYLKNETNYRVIEELRKRHKRFLTVQWAIVDSLINIFCSRYKIPLKFERTLPMEQFVDFLRAHKNDPLLR